MIGGSEDETVAWILNVQSLCYWKAQFFKIIFLFEENFIKAVPNLD